MTMAEDEGVWMRIFRFVGLLAFTLTAILTTGAVSAGASAPQPVILRNPRSVVHLVPGASFTFVASADAASTVFWVVNSPDGLTHTLNDGTIAYTRTRALKSTFTFGPFSASESGWEIQAVFVNNATNIPQVANSSLGVVLLKRTPGR
jgi:hypothetical protein